MSDAKTNEEYQPVIPRAVREQAERADQIARELGVANTPGLEEYQAEQNQAEQNQAAGNGADSTSPSASAEQSPTGGEVHQETWEQRYRTLQGKYDAEIPVLRGQISQLQTLIASMNTAPPSVPVQEFTPPAQRYSPTQVSPEDREMWGDDLPAAVSRWAEGSLGERFNRLEYENQQLRDQLNNVAQSAGQTQATITQDKVIQALDRDPQIGQRWRALNEDAQFLAWLNQADPFSGHLRMNLIRDAYAQGDAFRVGQFFSSFLTGHTAPAGGVVRSQTGANGTNGSGASAGNVNLASLVAPGRSSVSSGNGGAQPEKRSWTNQEIGAFYRDVNRGRYRGREAERLSTEADILAAAAEGRVYSN